MIPKLPGMFTGIVQTTGRVAALERNAFGVRLTIDRGDWQPAQGRAPLPGDSICVSGVCLTVAAIDGSALAFDVIAQTLAMTTLGGLAEGDAVNLEPAVTASQPLGGHFMQGHVDGVGTIADVVATEAEWRITVRPPAGLMRYIIPKGSVAIDGVSLTLADVADQTFDVALIPTTLGLTTLGQRKQSDSVNLEADILAKTVVASLERMRRGGAKDEPVTMDLLRAAGFAQ